MQNKFFTGLSVLLSLATIALLGVTFAGILLPRATSGVALALFATQLLLLGLDLWSQGKKILAFLAILPAGMGLALAAMLFF